MFSLYDRWSLKISPLLVMASEWSIRCWLIFEPSRNIFFRNGSIYRLGMLNYFQHSGCIIPYSVAHCKQKSPSFQQSLYCLSCKNSIFRFFEENQARPVQCSRAISTTKCAGYNPYPTHAGSRTSFLIGRSISGRARIAMACIRSQGDTSGTRNPGMD